MCSLAGDNSLVSAIRAGKALISRSVRCILLAVCAQDSVMKLSNIASAASVTALLAVAGSEPIPGKHSVPTCTDAKNLMEAGKVRMAEVFGSFYVSDVVVVLSFLLF